MGQVEEVINLPHSVNESNDDSFAVLHEHYGYVSFACASNLLFFLAHFLHYFNPFFLLLFIRHENLQKKDKPRCSCDVLIRAANEVHVSNKTKDQKRSAAKDYNVYRRTLTL